MRYSGTEPLLRVMLEGRNQDEIRTWAQEIIDVVRAHLGVDPRPPDPRSPDPKSPDPKSL